MSRTVVDPGENLLVPFATKRPLASLCSGTAGSSTAHPCIHAAATIKTEMIVLMTVAPFRVVRVDGCTPRTARAKHNADAAPRALTRIALRDSSGRRPPLHEL